MQEALLAMGMDISGGGASELRAMFSSGGGALVPVGDMQLGSCGGAWMNMSGEPESRRETGSEMALLNGPGSRRETGTDMALLGGLNGPASGARSTRQ